MLLQQTALVRELGVVVLSIQPERDLGVTGCASMVGDRNKSAGRPKPKRGAHQGYTVKLHQPLESEAIASTGP